MEGRSRGAHSIVVFLILFCCVTSVLWFSSTLVPYLRTFVYCPYLNSKNNETSGSVSQQIYHQTSKQPSIIMEKIQVIDDIDIDLNNLKPKTSNSKEDNYENILIIDEVEIDSNSNGHKPERINTAQCEDIKDDNKFDCYPVGLVDKSSCEKRGCCYKPVLGQTSNQSEGLFPPLKTPWCYFPLDYKGYQVDKVSNTDLGFNADLSRTSQAAYPETIMNLKVEVRYETQSRLRIKIYDPKTARYKVPLNTPVVTKADNDTMYSVNISKTSQQFAFTVKRIENSVNILNTVNAGPLTFCNQFIELSSFLPSSFIYGLGEHRSKLLLDVNRTRLTMWNKDNPPHEKTNLYGMHPFYLMMENDGKSHGVFLLNSNAMDVLLQPSPAITWRTIGGIIDLYVFMGPTPAEVIQQYTEVIGRSFMPPYWSLGFHLCRWGYKTANDTVAIMDKLRAAGMPQDVQWNDIDYMDKKKDFTYGTEFGDMPAMVNTAHSRGMHYIMIVDPGISNQSPGQYEPYDLGMDMDIFIKGSQGKPLIGKVWPGNVVFPDFTNNKTFQYWTRMVKKFHDQVPFDGMWIDMNEISNFVAGSTSSCPNNNIENPPYVPDVAGGTLRFSTICATSQQNVSIAYNVHNLYGITETAASYVALKSTRNKRPFIISRSTYAGQGYYGGHWSGDNFATHYDMAMSIPEMLNFNMFGISMIGADICGFLLDTTEELCQRWYQLGAFYPFSRSHNALGLKADLYETGIQILMECFTLTHNGETEQLILKKVIVSKSQEPTAFSPSLLESTKTAYNIRYTLLPYLYTLFHKSHMMGDTVVRPLFFEFPSDKKTYKIDTQFLWGSSLMISPALVKAAVTVDSYFPAGIWYDWYTGKAINSNGTVFRLSAPTNMINLHTRGGSIIVLQDPALTTTESRKNKYSLLVSLDGEGSAEGDLFWDDGDTIDTHAQGKFNMLRYQSSKNTVSSEVMHAGYTDEPMTLRSVVVYGVLQKPNTVNVNGQVITTVKYDVNLHVLRVDGLSSDMLQSFTLQWM